ncbi:MAG: helix-turn-helix domain-containing protein [Candidatus Alkanophagales archaeon]
MSKNERVELPPFEAFKMLKAIVDILSGGAKTASELRKFFFERCRCKGYKTLYELLRVLQELRVVRSYREGHKVYYELERP